MKTSTEQLGRVLRGGSFRLFLTADVFYGPNRVMQDAQVTDWSFSGDLDAEIATSGSLTVVHQGDFGDSRTPRSVSDPLAPFGQIVIPYITITAGPFRERLQLGVYRIDDVPEAEDHFITRGGRRLVVGSRVKLELLDLFVGVKRALFRSLDQPAALTSAWAEIARITRLPVTRTVPDTAIPTMLTYDRSRLEATQVLASILNGRAVMLSDGTVGIVPDQPGSVVADLKIGDDEGVLLDVGYAMSSDGIPNVVIGDFEDSLGNSIHVESETVDGPLAVSGPYGENVIEYPAEKKALVTSRAQAQLVLDAYRIRLQTAAYAEIPITALIDPRLELGDVIRAHRPDRILTGRIRKYSIAKASPMRLTVEVLDDAPIQ